MFLLTPEQLNVTRQSFRNGDWIEGMRIASGPVRSSLRRFAKAALRRRIRGTLPPPGPASSIVFSENICSLFAQMVTDLPKVVGLEHLFSDVDRQIRGEFRLAGCGYKRIEFGTADRFSEAENQHAFDRLYWMARYARAAAFGHSGAISALRSSWSKWLRTAHGPGAFAAYTLAERIASLSECLFWIGHCADDLDADEIISLKRQIWNDAHRLSGNIEYGLGVHNHLLNDARGLFRASRVLPHLDEAAVWQEQAFRLWDEFFPQLILADGSFAEQSSHYQLLLCRTALEYFLAARLLHKALPDGTQLQLSGMFQLANDLLRPDGSLPRFGDNSPDQTVEDLWGVMAAANHCGLLKTRPRHGVVTPLTLMYCGEVPQPPATNLPSRDCAYPEGGFMFLRSMNEELELIVHADPRPEARAHGDSGRGSFELWWRGQIVVREPGSILSSSNPRSSWSRSGLAQNVTCLNRLAPGVTSEDRTFLPSSYANQGGTWVLIRNHEIEFRWDGFERIRQGIVLWRTWRLSEPNDLLFEERIKGSGNVEFESRICLGDGRWELAHSDLANGDELKCTCVDGSIVNIWLKLPPGVIGALEDGWYLPEFGKEEVAPVLILTGNVQLPICWTARWQLCAPSYETSQELSRQCAE